MVIGEVAHEPPIRVGGTRELILEAAEQVLSERGLAGCTTRAIAEAAGCAEGSIYRYFADKHALFIEVVKRRFPVYLDLMASLPELAGTGDVVTHLREVARASLVFYRAILPMVAGAMADRELLAQQRAHFHSTGTGPMKIIGSVAEFMRVEQRKGRISRRASADHAARALLGTCYFQAYLEFFLGDEAAFGPDDVFAAETVQALMEGLRPAPSAKGRNR
jgi:AcrR family transcriptional regulator